MSRFRRYFAQPGHYLRKRFPFLFLILFNKNLDPVIKGYVIRLKFANLSCAFKIFRLQCSNVVLNFRVSKLEFHSNRRHGVGVTGSLRYAIDGFLSTWRAGH